MHLTHLCKDSSKNRLCLLQQKLRKLLLMGQTKQNSSPRKEEAGNHQQRWTSCPQCAICVRQL